MKRAADLLTWLVGIGEIIALWASCLSYFFIIQAYGSTQWWLIILPIVLTVVIFVLMLIRQASINEGEGYILWGVITLLFISIPGGILTICLENSYSYHPRRTTHYGGYHPTNSYSKTQNQEPKSNDLKAVEQKKAEEFIFVKPSFETKIDQGTIVKVKEGFYIQSISQRVNKDDICEVLEVYGNELIVMVNHSSSFFRATIALDNVLVKVQNPKFKEEQKEQAEKEDAIAKQNAELEQEKNSEENRIKLLREYKQLLDDGIITKEEFDLKKKELLK